MLIPYLGTNGIRVHTRRRFGNVCRQRHRTSLFFTLSPSSTPSPSFLLPSTPLTNGPLPQTNTTKTLTGPSTKDASATYTASTSALVQLSSSAGVSWMGYDSSAGTGTAWTAVKALPTVNLTSVSSGSGSASAGASSTGSGAVKPSGSAGTGSGGSTSGGVSVRVGGGYWWWNCLVVGVLGVGVGLLV